MQKGAWIATAVLGRFVQEMRDLQFPLLGISLEAVCIAGKAVLFLVFRPETF